MARTAPRPGRRACRATRPARAIRSLTPASSALKRLTLAAAHNGQGRSGYHGPTLIVLLLPHVRGFALTGEFEGVTSLGIAVTDRGPFHTFTLTHPHRIVIDVR